MALGYSWHPHALRSRKKEKEKRSTERKKEKRFPSDTFLPEVSKLPVLELIYNLLE